MTAAIDYAIVHWTWLHWMIAGITVFTAFYYGCMFFGWALERFDAWLASRRWRGER